MPTTPPPAPTNSTSYVLGPEDQITVRVFAADDIPDKPVQIDNDGTVTLPMIGQVHAAGLTVEQLQANLVTAYKKYFKDPQVTVQVNDFRSQPVSVAGNVNTPGVVQLQGNRNLMEVIGQAGGLRADAGDSVLITRNLSEGPDSGGRRLHRSDRQVLRRPHRYTRSHERQGSGRQHPDQAARCHHRSPRAHGLRAGQRRQARRLCHDRQRDHVDHPGDCLGRRMGQNRSASSAARVLRADGGPEREQIPANVKKIMENKAPDLQLQPDDILYVPNSMGKQIGSARAGSSHWARDRRSHLALEHLLPLHSTFLRMAPCETPGLTGGRTLSKANCTVNADRFHDSEPQIKSERTTKR